MNRIFKPLGSDHPLVEDQSWRCPFCKRWFYTGQRVTLISIDASSTLEANVPAVPAHATCAFRGAKIPHGKIERIKDGDGSPYAVVTDRGQFTIEECGLQE